MATHLSSGELSPQLKTKEIPDFNGIFTIFESDSEGLELEADQVPSGCEISVVSEDRQVVGNSVF
jgi:hypothetical protein